MKKFVRSFSTTALVLACCISLSISALAVERASFYLSKYSAYASAADDGKIEIVVSVVANRRVSELGASYILLEESDDGGRTWSIAEEFEDESWMTTTDRSTYSAILTHQGIIGHQYRVTADVFAEDENGGDSRTTPTSTAVTAKR